MRIILAIASGFGCIMICHWLATWAIFADGIVVGHRFHPAIDYALMYVIPFFLGGMVAAWASEPCDLRKTISWMFGLVLALVLVFYSFGHDFDKTLSQGLLTVLPGAEIILGALVAWLLKRPERIPRPDAMK